MTHPLTFPLAYISSTIEKTKIPFICLSNCWLKALEDCTFSVSHISIVEITIDNLNTDPSFGSHFFHNLTNLRIGYLTQDKKNKPFDQEWIDSCKIKKETQYR